MNLATAVPADAEIPALPEGWTLTHIGEVCEINPVKPPSGALSADAPVTFVPMPAVDAVEGAIKAPQTRAFAEVRKGFTSFRNNDVIMAKITPCMENGKAAIARNLTNGLGFGSTEFHVLRPTMAVLPEYIYSFIRQESYRRAAESEMTGSVGQKRVPESFLELTDFLLPPLAEQVRIVKKLTELLNNVKACGERLSKAGSILKRFRKAVVTAACSGRLTADWRIGRASYSASLLLERVLREREEDWKARQKTSPKKNTSYPTPFEPHVDGLPEIPESWVWATLDQLITDGPQNGLYKPQTDYGQGLPIIRIEDFQDNWVRERNALSTLRVTAHEAKVYGVEAGDLLINRVNSPSHIGKALVVARELCPAAFESNMMRMHFSNAIQPMWVAVWLRSTDGKMRLTENSKWAVNQVSINQTDVRSTAVPLPPMEEQREIIARINTLLRVADALEKSVAFAASRSDKLAQAILSKAFRGELVPTEAERARREGRQYEPASMLLERIRAERANQVKPPPVGKRKAKKSTALVEA